MKQPLDAANTVPRGRTVAVLAAAVIAITCLTPLFLWGNPYPTGVLLYWAWGTTTALVIAAIASRIGPEKLPRIDSLTRVPTVAFAVIVCSAAAGLAAMFAIYTFHGAASTSDEIAQLWQARILLQGHLSLPVDPNREFFALETVVDTGRWYSQFPIGGPATLIPGALVGLPWLTNSIMAGLSTVAMYRVARHAYGECEGRAVAALFCITPMMLMMAGTWMNHVPVLFLTTLALTWLAEWERATTKGRALIFAALIGLSLGLTATIRPLDALVVSAVLGCFQLLSSRSIRERIESLMVQGAAGFVGVAPLFYANHATTGSVLRFGYDVLWGNGHRLGFHTDPYGATHTLGRGLTYAMTYVGELNTNLLAWPVPAMLIVIVGLLAMRKVSRWDGLFLGLFAAQVVAYATYWYDGEFLGPRFLYTALPAIVVLTARAPFVLAERFGERSRREIFAFMGVCFVIAWVAPGVDFNAWGLARQARGARGMLKVDPGAAVQDAGIHHALIFMREPFTSRLTRRLWGLGFTRSETAQLVASRDACSLFLAVQAAEHGSVASAPTTLRSLVNASDSIVQRRRQTTHDGQLADAIAVPCQTELDDDRRLGGAAFGPALPLEPIDDGGRIAGDIVYVADLSDRNQVLKSRFGDRTWFRFVVGRTSNGQMRGVLRPY